jgi:hypothetical protein
MAAQPCGTAQADNLVSALLQHARVAFLLVACPRAPHAHQRAHRARRVQRPDPHHSARGAVHVDGSGGHGGGQPRQPATNGHLIEAAWAPTPPAASGEWPARRLNNRRDERCAGLTWLPRCSSPPWPCCGSLQRGAGRVRCVSRLLGKNRRCIHVIGKSQPKRTPKRTQRPPHLQGHPPGQRPDINTLPHQIITPGWTEICLRFRCATELLSTIGGHTAACAGAR